MFSARVRSFGLATLLGALAACGGPPPPPSCPGCNVVLVTFDALRADRLGAYGHAKPTSPAIDAFARRSTVFTDCVSQCGTTAGSVPSILTGKFVVADRLLDGLALRAEEPTIATVLRAAGYRTLALIAHEYARCAYSGCVGFDVVEDRFPVPERAGRTAERVEAMLEIQTREPFFLWVHVRQPHAPYDVDAEDFATMYDAGAEAMTYFSPGVRALGLFQATGKLVRHYEAAGELRTYQHLVDGRLHAVTPTVLRQLQALYDANVRAGDRVFGRIVDALDRHGLAARTVVVLGADHGESLGEHDWFGHNRLWQGVLHTPLVVHVPGTPPRTIGEPVMNVDILPTVARLVGASLPAPVRGRDLFGPRSADDVQYAEYSGSYVLIQRRSKIRVQVGRKSPMAQQIAGPPRVDGLWDLIADPAEERNLASTRPEAAEQLFALGEALRRRGLGTGGKIPSVDLRERLRQLGYIAPDAPRDE